MNLVWQGYTGQGGSDMLVLVALADWADNDGRCFPSMNAIGKRVKLSRSQAQRVVHRLVDSGWVTVAGNALGGAPGSSCRFQLAVERMATGSTDATPTGSTGATGSAHATGSTDAADGSHGCGETGSTGATLTIIEPSITTKKAADAATFPKHRIRKSSGKAPVTLATYLERCDADGRKPVPDDHAIRRYANDVGLDDEMLQIAWIEFRDRHLSDRSGKRQKDWPATFANSVKARWYGLWYIGQDGRPAWSSNGLQARAAIEARELRAGEAHA